MYSLRDNMMRRLTNYILNYNVLRVVLALVLLFAAGFKCHYLANNALPETNVLSSRAFNITLVLVELGFGLWLLCGLYPTITRFLAVALLLLFFEGALYDAVKGSNSCRCFGSLALNPWFSATFDILMAGAILASRHEPTAEVPYFPRKSALGAFLVTFFMIAIPALLTMVNYRSQLIARELREDPRLSAPVALDMKRPRTKDILKKLELATEVTIELDEKLEENEPDFGYIKTGSSPAWALMELVAQKQPLMARWDKEGCCCYRLVYISPMTAGVGPWLMSAGLGGMLLLGLAVKTIRSHAATWGNGGQVG